MEIGVKLENRSGEGGKDFLIISQTFESGVCGGGQVGFDSKMVCTVE